MGETRACITLLNDPRRQTQGWRVMKSGDLAAVWIGGWEGNFLAVNTHHPVPGSKASLRFTQYFSYGVGINNLQRQACWNLFT